MLSESPTTQEVYEHIRAFFLKQGKLARIERKVGGVDGERTYTDCVYRSEAGLKCAVGCLISDELYFTDLGGLTLGEEIEARPVDGIAHYPLLVDLLDGDSEEGERKLGFLVEAQKIHDNKHTTPDVPTFIRSLDTLAQAYDLKLVA